VATCVPQQDVRSSGRIAKEIPIFLIGSDLDGKVFSEPTNTVLLSLHGAGIVSRHKLSPEQELILRCPERNIEAEIRVVGQRGSQQGIYASTRPLPQTSAPSQSMGYPAGSDLVVERLGAVLTLPPPPELEAPRANRRKHARVKVSYSASVRHAERGDDIVTCEDMFRGGLRFKSRKRYYDGTLIEVTVPYTRGPPAIFVPAQIVFFQELPEQQLFRYGVAYLQFPKLSNHC
jgi:PilZ domain-containing protein